MPNQNSKPTNENQTKSQLHSAILLIYMANSEKQLKTLVEHGLPRLCHIHSIELTTKKPHRSRLNYIYSFKYHLKEYFICFHKQSSFLKSEKSFLKKIAQALELAVTTLEKQKELEVHKFSWEQAFDAISSPICLSDLEGNIIKTNKAFRTAVQKSKQDLQQKNYFAVFFGKEKKENKKPLMKIINGKKHIFKVSEQKVTPDIQLVILRDVTQQVEMEKTASQSAKKTELGILSSSIAHELNNPIAGIHLLLQNLQISAEKKQDIAIQKDLKEMLYAVQKCAELIDKLLNP